MAQIKGTRNANPQMFDHQKFIDFYDGTELAEGAFWEGHYRVSVGLGNVHKLGCLVADAVLDSFATFIGGDGMTVLARLEDKIAELRTEALRAAMIRLKLPGKPPSPAPRPGEDDDEDADDDDGQTPTPEPSLN